LRLWFRYIDTVAYESPMRSLKTIFVVMALLLAGSAVVMYWTSQTVARVNTRLVTTETALAGLEDVMSTIKDAETGQRGFLLTGKPEYLAPYNAAVARINAGLLKIDGINSSSEFSPKDAGQLRTLINEKLTELSHTINLRESSGLDAAVAVVNTDRGKATMVAIRDLVARMIQKKSDERAALRANADQAALFRTSVFAVICVVNVGFLIWAYRKILFGIIEREIAAEELRKQKELLSVTLSSIGDGVIVADSRSKITFMNAEAEKLTGWSLSAAGGQPCETVFNIINEASRVRVESPVEKVLRLGTVVGLANHTLLVRPDGSEIAIDDSGAPIRNADGTIHGVVLVFRDFSEHKASEKKLRDAFLLLDTVTNSTSDLIYAKDRNGKMLFANKATLATVGKSPEQVMGQSEDQWHDNRAQADAIIAFDRQVMDSGKADSIEEIFSGPGGTRIYLSTKSPMVDEHGTIYGIVGVSRDMTERKRAQSELIAAKEAAESANIAKDNFLATLSHELRTPLTPVLATLNIWEADTDLPETLVRDVEVMRRNIELEARLIDDLLDLTRIAKGKLPLNLETADVHALLTAVTTMYQSDIRAKRLKLELKLDAPQQFVRGDPARLQQVFWNILKNATKFTPEGGKIEISSHNDSEGRVQLLFRDTGIGMTEEMVARLFHPFEQGSAEMIRQYGGLGLGMAISRALLDAQKGEINAQSEGPGKGSTFTVSLGCVPAPDQQASSPARQRPNRDGQRILKILLVEDHADTARVMSRLLRGMGHEVRVADSVAGAMESARQPFDMLLSDIGLPDGTGLELIQQIRQQYGDKFPAVALTGYGMEDDIAKCKAAGFNDHLTKPMSVQKLELVIQRVAMQPA
jgi:PAS domain S-box-containing protein